MAIITYPLNGVDYYAEDAETYLCTRTSGVYSAENNFSVSITGARQITISPGIAWMQDGDFRGKVVCNTEPVSLDIPISDGTRPRIDRIVLRLDKSLLSSSLQVITGSPSSSPVAPAISRTDVIFDLGLYTIRSNAGGLIVSMSDISNTMLDEDVCGLMRDGVTGIPTQQLQEQAEEILDSLRQALVDVSTGSGVMLTAVYDPEGIGKPYAPKDEVLDKSAYTDTNGVLLPNKGGTGQTSLQAARNAMGLGNTTGALPVANGGTGQTSLAAARNAMGLGNTTGALPVANGGTGSANAQAALGNLGASSRPNLLYNANFYTPVNSLGKTSYQATGISYAPCIDGWSLSYAGNIQLNSASITLYTTGATTTDKKEIIYNFLSREVYEQIQGQTVTLSVLAKVGTENELKTISYVVPVGVDSFSSGFITLSGGAQCNFNKSKTAQTPFVRFFANDAIGQFNVVAVKLEMGSGQTLAYQDGAGQWQLLESAQPANAFWGGYKVYQCTQAQYDAITAPDANTLYLIVG